MVQIYLGRQKSHWIFGNFRFPEWARTGKNSNTDNAPGSNISCKASEINFCDIKYLAKYSFGYTFNFGKNT